MNAKVSYVAIKWELLQLTTMTTTTKNTRAKYEYTAMICQVILYEVTKTNLNIDRYPQK